MFLEVALLNGQSCVVNVDEIECLWQNQEIGILDMIAPRDGVSSSLRLRLESEAANSLHHKLLYPNPRFAIGSSFVHVEKLTINLLQVLTLQPAIENFTGMLTFKSGATCPLNPHSFAALKSRLLQPWNIPAKPDGLLPELTLQPNVIADQVQDALLSGHPLTQTIHNVTSDFR